VKDLDHPKVFLPCLRQIDKSAYRCLRLSWPLQSQQHVQSVLSRPILSASYFDIRRSDLDNTKSYSIWQVCSLQASSASRFPSDKKQPLRMFCQVILGWGPSFLCRHRGPFPGPARSCPRAREWTVVGGSSPWQDRRWSRASWRWGLHVHWPVSVRFHSCTVFEIY